MAVCRMPETKELKKQENKFNFISMTATSSKSYQKILNKFPGIKKILLEIYHFCLAQIPQIVGWPVRIPAFLSHINKSQIIAKPGFLSYGAVFNPGAILLNDHVLLLANGQYVPWFKARGKKREFYMKGNPVIIWLDKVTKKITEKYVITTLDGLPSGSDNAIEDFRLFMWKGKIMINHSLVTKRGPDSLIAQIRVQSALSKFNEKEQTIQFWAIPQLDFEVNQFEKNWMYYEESGKLLLFYSVSPFRVLVLEDESSMAFRTYVHEIQKNKLSDPGGFGTLVSFSTNPIAYDNEHWFMVIHQIKYKITGRCYYHWGVLIDKETCKPVKITSKPIFSGMGARGRVPGYRYISSVIKKGDEFLFFAGEGDVYVTLTKKKISEFESIFVPV